MSIIDRVREYLTPKAEASPENPRVNLSQWYSEMTGSGYDLPTLPRVTEASARTVSALYRGVSLLSGAVALLPLRIIHRPTNSISTVVNHRLSPLLDYQPDPKNSMTAFTWKSLIISSRVYGGNFFSRILYDNAARVIGLRYYPYQRVRVIPQMQPPYKRFYILQEPDGTQSDPVPDDEMIHVLAESNDGIVGESTIFAHAKSSIQMSLFLQQQARAVHSESIKPGGVVELPPGLNKDQKKRYEEFFKQAYSGSANSGKILWLDSGAKFTPLSPSLSLVDLNTIEFLRFQVDDIARYLGIPSHLLNEQSQSSAWGTGIEQIGRSFLTYTLEPHLRAIETELQLKLFGNSEYAPQFDRSALLSMDAKTGAETESAKINAGIWTINERRKLDNLPPVDGGDQPLVNSTMVPLSQAIAEPDPAPEVSEPADQPPPPAKPKRTRRTTTTG